MAKTARAIKYRKCNICESSDAVLLYCIDGFDIVKCTNCKLAFTDNVLSREEILNTYDKEFFTQNGRIEYYILDEKSNEINSKKRLDRLKKYKSSGELLDVGCGFGHFLHYLKDEGSFSAGGVEVSPFAASHCTDTYSLDVTCTDFIEFEGKEESYDIITMFDYIEHVNDPKENVIKAARLLREGGLLIITTGDMASVTAKALGRFWELLKPEQHLYYFQSGNLSRLLSDCGFDVEDISHDGKHYSSEYLTEKLRKRLRPGAVSSAFSAACGIGRKLHLIPGSVYINLFDIMTVIAVKK